MVVTRSSGWGPSLLVVLFVALLVVCLALLVAAPPCHALAAPLHWRGVTHGGVGSRALTAIAVSPDGKRLAVSDDQGVSLRILEAGERFERSVRVADVRDLHFDARGALWIASRDGLWNLSPDGRLERRALAPGEARRGVERIVSAGGVVAASGEFGVYASIDGRSWSRLRDGLPSRAVSALALRALSAQTIECWVAVDRKLWRLELRRSSDRIEISAAAEQPISGQPSSDAAVDLVLGLEGADVAVLYPRALLLLDPPDASVSLRRSRIWRPVLPPGARARRLVGAGGRVWLATDRGLLWSTRLFEPWLRAGSPAGSVATRGVAAFGDRVFAGTEQGLLEAEWRQPASAVLMSSVSGGTGLPPRAPGAFEPEVRAVQTAALRYQGLGPDHFRRLRSRLSRRGWLPTLGLHVDWEDQRDWRRDTDEAFLSGDTRRLFDREVDRGRDLGAALSLTWNLRDVAYDPESVDLSREARQVISLRDDVLDEINQLYFERRSVLESLESQADDAAAEIQRLRRRAAELVAGLDAWTGGWFSAALARPDSSGLGIE